MILDIWYQVALNNRRTKFFDVAGIEYRISNIEIRYLVLTFVLFYRCCIIRQVNSDIDVYHCLIIIRGMIWYLGYDVYHLPPPPGTCFVAGPKLA